MNDPSLRAYLYAITDRPGQELPKGKGLEETELYRHIFRDISAVCSPITSSSVVATADNIWRHETIVESLMAEHTVLPVRFGTILAGAGAVREALSLQYALLVRTMERLQGCVELGFRVLWREQKPITEGERTQRTPPLASTSDAALGMATGGGDVPFESGRAYLSARMEAERMACSRRCEAEDLATVLHQELAQFVIDSRRQILLTPRLMLSVAYLLPRDHVPRFRAQVEALTEAYPDLCFLVTGPWPAYSFAQIPLGGDEVVQNA